MAVSSSEIWCLSLKANNAIQGKGKLVIHFYLEVIELFSHTSLEYIGATSSIVDILGLGSLHLENKIVNTIEIGKVELFNTEVDDPNTF